MSTSPEISNLFKTTRMSKAYSRYRPTYPHTMLDRIISFSSKQYTTFRLAVDVACGTGKSTRLLAGHFQQVIGIDISPSQIAEAIATEKMPNITYQVGPAESLSVKTNSVDLVTVGAGIHWLELETFYSEVDRVLRPGGCVAIYGFNPKRLVLYFQDKTTSLTELYKEVLFETYKAFWEWEHVLLPMNSYRDLPLPYEENAKYDDLKKADEITVADLIGYTSSLSFYSTYEKNHPGDKTLLQTLQDRIMAVLEVNTSPEETKIIRELPLSLCLARKPL